MVSYINSVIIYAYFEGMTPRAIIRTNYTKNV